MAHLNRTQDKYSLTIAKFFSGLASNYCMMDEWRKEGELTGTDRHILATDWWVLMGFVGFRSRRSEAVCAWPYNCCSFSPDWSWASYLLVDHTGTRCIGGSPREPRIRLKLAVEARETSMAGGGCGCAVASCLHSCSRIIRYHVLLALRFCRLGDWFKFDWVHTSLLS